MKSGLVAGVVAAVLPIAALAAAQAPQAAIPHTTGVKEAATPTSSPPMLGSTSTIVFGVGEPGSLAALDLNAPVTRVVTAPPTAATNTEGDDEVEPASAPPMESSVYALWLAGLAVLLFIAHRLRQD